MHDLLRTATCKVTRDHRRTPSKSHDVKQTELTALDLVLLALPVGVAVGSERVARRARVVQVEPAVVRAGRAQAARGGVRTRVVEPSSEAHCRGTERARLTGVFHTGRAMSEFLTLTSER